MSETRGISCAHCGEQLDHRWTEHFDNTGRCKSTPAPSPSSPAGTGEADGGAG